MVAILLQDPIRS